MSQYLLLTKLVAIVTLGVVLTSCKKEVICAATSFSAGEFVDCVLEAESLNLTEEETFTLIVLEAVLSYSANGDAPFSMNTNGSSGMSIGPLSPFSGGVSPRVKPRTMTTSPTQHGQASGFFVLADFNHDGTPDTVALTPTGLRISLFRADGSTISVKPYPISNLGTASIVAADFNKDGNLDIAITQAGQTSGSVSVLLGNGDGTFGPPMPLPAISQFPFYLVAADLNGDGIPDLAVTLESSTGSGNDSVDVFLGKGDGTFASPAVYTVGQGVGTIVAVDVNNDGHLDLIALGSRRDIVNHVWTLLGLGDGTFQPALSAPTGTGSATLSYADINNDGNIDLLIADQSASAMAVMLGKGDGTYSSPVEYIAAGQVAGISLVPLADGSTLLLMADNVVPLARGFKVGSDGTVASPVLQRVGVAPSSIAAGDLNLDGKPDLVITDSGSASVIVKLGMGGGAFGPAVPYSVNANPGPLLLLDINGDGKLDAVTADANGLEVLLGKGDGTFSPASNIPASSSLTSLTAADFNGDGAIDIAAADAASGRVIVFLGKGDGTFPSTKSILLGSGFIALSVVSGNLNQDNKPDLVATFQPTDATQAGGLAVLLGKGDGTFQPPAMITLPGPVVFNPTAPLAVADFNKDGNLDVVTVVQGSGSNQLVLFLGDGDGTFQAPSSQPTITHPPSIAVADVDGDGNPDVLLTDCCLAAEGSFLQGNGDGTFQPEISIPSGPNPRAVAVADFNGDGKPDGAIIGQVTDEGPGLGQPFGTLAIALNTLSPASSTSTTTSVAASSATFSPNAQSVSVSATVSGGGVPLSGGTVTFTLFGSSVPGAVNNGSASAVLAIPAGTNAGSYTIQATYTPSGTGFTSSSGSAQLSIAKATPVITWPTPGSIVSGTPLSGTQLDATANVPGAFAYTPPSTTVLPVGNNQTLSVLFTPTDTTDYNTQTATVSINVTAPSAPALTIAKSHSASFTVGGTGTYMIVVGNATGAGATSGALTVTDNAPTGLTVTAMSGTGWSCPALPTCMRSDPLQPGQSYLPIMVTVNVAANAPSSLTNMATVSGGGSASATATDPTTIGTAGPSQFAFTWTANPTAGGSVTPASGSLFTAGTTITVSATPTACYLFSSYSGALVGTTNPAMLLINAPQSVVANFTLNAKTNVTPQITTQLSGFRYNRLNQTYAQGLSVTNNGPALNGPVYVALDSLSAGATLTGALGTTQCASPAGSAYALVSNTGIGAGQSLTLTVQFTSQAGPPFLYTPRYLAGTGLQ